MLYREVNKIYQEMTSGYPRNGMVLGLKGRSKVKVTGSISIFFTLIPGE